VDVEVVFADIPVSDLQAALPWYERLLGRPADIVVKDDEVMWRLAEIDGRGIESPPVQIEGGSARKAPYTDPDGNTVALIEVRGSTDEPSEGPAQPLAGSDRA
jgi:predicted enzyme related to lactoylglutathione lyase